MNKKIKKITTGMVCAASLFVAIAPTNVFAASANGNCGGKSVGASLAIEKNKSKVYATTTISSGQAALEANVTFTCFRGSNVIKTYGRASNYSSAVSATASKERGTDDPVRAESSHQVFNNNATWKRNLVKNV